MDTSKMTRLLFEAAEDLQDGVALREGTEALLIEAANRLLEMEFEIEDLRANACLNHYSVMR